MCFAWFRQFWMKQRQWGWDWRVLNLLEFELQIVEGKFKSLLTKPVINIIDCFAYHEFKLIFIVLLSTSCMFAFFHSLPHFTMETISTLVCIVPLEFIECIEKILQSKPSSTMLYKAAKSFFLLSSASDQIDFKSLTAGVLFKSQR